MLPCRWAVAPLVGYVLGVLRRKVLSDLIDRHGDVAPHRGEYVRMPRKSPQNGSSFFLPILRTSPILVRKL
jgi:hypothetical protein